MSNLYESSSYNILSIYKNSDSYLFKIQRLPTSVYPEITEIVLTTEQVEPDLAQNDLIDQALPFIDSALSVFDSSFNGSPSIETDTELYNYSQIFT